MSSSYTEVITISDSEDEFDDIAESTPYPMTPTPANYQPSTSPVSPESPVYEELRSRSPQPGPSGLPQYHQLRAYYLVGVDYLPVAGDNYNGYTEEMGYPPTSPSFYSPTSPTYGPHTNDEDTVIDDDPEGRFEKTDSENTLMDIIIQHIEAARPPSPEGITDTEDDPDDGSYTCIMCDENTPRVMFGWCTIGHSP